MIQVFRPFVNTDDVLSSLRHVLDSGWIGPGPKVAELEGVLSKTFNRSVVCVDSCTAALHLAVKSLGLKRHCMVATTPISFVSTNHSLLYEGLHPVFVDVEPRTGNIDADKLEETVNRFPIDAVVVVHMGGYPCDMERINQIAMNVGIPVIEDCAHAFGSVYENGNTVGMSENLCCFSFHAVKNLGIGNGGAIVLPKTTRKPESWFRQMRWMGIDTSTIERSTESKYKWEYGVDEVGYKYDMTDISATVALCQLKKLAEANEKRKQIAERYRHELTTTQLPTYDENRKSSYHFFPVFHRERNKLLERLSAAGIGAGMHYKRNDRYYCYKHFVARENLSGAEWYEQREITLPIHECLSEEDVDLIVKVVNQE